MADILPEKWMKGVAITTTCLAVMTAIAAARSTVCISKTQILTAVEGSKWAYYQAKSLKQNLAEAQKNAFEAAILGAANPAQDAAYKEKLETIKKEVVRYENEKTQIRKEAEDTADKNGRLAKKTIFFSASVVFFQIAIMLSSVSALLKKRYMWLIGLVFSVIAIVLLGYGLFLQPLLF